MPMIPRHPVAKGNHFGEVSYLDSLKSYETKNNIIKIHKLKINNNKL